jgi:hypothetical protein
VLILVVEFIGLTSVLPYGLMLPFYTSSSGSKGLPIDDGCVVLPADKRFRVHILVPCYKVCFLHHLHACMPSDLSVLTCRFRHVCVCVCACLLEPA